MLNDDFQADYKTWESSWESLKKWQELSRQYEEAYGTLKI
jgi:hypothetical protein